MHESAKPLLIALLVVLSEVPIPPFPELLLSQVPHKLEPVVQFVFRPDQWLVALASKPFVKGKLKIPAVVVVPIVVVSSDRI